MPWPLAARFNRRNSSSAKFKFTEDAAPIKSRLAHVSGLQLAVDESHGAPHDGSTGSAGCAAAQKTLMSALKLFMSAVGSSPSG